MRIPRILKKLSVERLKELVRYKERLEKADHFGRLKDKLMKKVSRLEAKIAALAGGTKQGRRKKKFFSAATRKKLSARLKLYWASRKKNPKPAVQA